MVFPKFKFHLWIHFHPFSFISDDFCSRIFSGRFSRSNSLRMVQESCDAGPFTKNCGGSLKDLCAKGFSKVIQTADLQKNQVLNLTKEENCEIHVVSSLSHFGGFPAFVANDSHWQLGADRPGKFGWIANEAPKIPAPKAEAKQAELRYEQLTTSEIVFVVRLVMGIVFVDYLYLNVAFRSCFFFLQHPPQKNIRMWMKKSPTVDCIFVIPN